MALPLAHARARRAGRAHRGCLRLGAAGAEHGSKRDSTRRRPRARRMRASGPWWAGGADSASSRSPPGAASRCRRALAAGPGTPYQAAVLRLNEKLYRIRRHRIPSRRGRRGARRAPRWSSWFVSPTAPVPGGAGRAPQSPRVGPGLLSGPVRGVAGRAQAPARCCIARDGLRRAGTSPLQGLQRPGGVGLKPA